MINQLSKPFKWFFKLEAASGLVLLISAILALIISNSDLSNLYFETLDKIFELISKCELDRLNIIDLLESPVCHSGFKRLN